MRDPQRHSYRLMGIGEDDVASHVSDDAFERCPDVFENIHNVVPQTVGAHTGTGSLSD